MNTRARDLKGGPEFCLTGSPLTQEFEELQDTSKHPAESSFVNQTSVHVMPRLLRTSNSWSLLANQRPRGGVPSPGCCGCGEWDVYLAHSSGASRRGGADPAERLRGFRAWREKGKRGGAAGWRSDTEEEEEEEAPCSGRGSVLPAPTSRAALATSATEVLVPALPGGSRSLAAPLSDLCSPAAGNGNTRRRELNPSIFEAGTRRLVDPRGCELTGGHTCGQVQGVFFLRRQCGCTRSFLACQSGAERRHPPARRRRGAPRVAKSGSKSQPRAVTVEVRRGGSATASYRYNVAEGHQVG
ncbi:hypothetical protein FQA47_020231 [Oryzias melastigma]|uniref:Uncharacterized protein n=1 Tax=Oryzias melastigma TaxID=30732 RepID=A0A834C0J6_ORYME|nr:hypothetical protein FQA47_020231 [Oryzias melastigma]